MLSNEVICTCDESGDKRGVLGRFGMSGDFGLFMMI